MSWSFVNVWMDLLDSQFYEMPGRRNIITFITDAEKDPMLMGFSLVDEQPAAFPVEADVEHDVEIADDVGEIEGRDIPEGQMVVEPIPEDKVTVNGTVLRETSSLGALRAGCSFYGDSMVFQPQVRNRIVSSV